MSTIFRVDSRDRDADSISNTSFAVNCIPTHCVHARLKQIIIPNVFDNIRASPASDANSTFSYETAGAPATVVIPDGFYTIDDLLTLLEAALVALTITFSLNTNTGKITITNGGAATFEVINLADGNAMADALGITVTETLAAAGTATFGNKVNMISHSVIYVESRILSNGHGVTSSTSRLPIIATIPVDVVYGSNINYTPTTQHIVYFGDNTNIESTDIRLTNHSGETLTIGSNHHIQVLVDFNTTVVH